MQQDNNGCDMEYELEDDADSHHNIRVQSQTEMDPEIEVVVNVEVQPEIEVEENNEVEAEVGVQLEVDQIRVEEKNEVEVELGVQTEVDQIRVKETGADAVVITTATTNIESGKSLFTSAITIIIAATTTGNTPSRITNSCRKSPMPPSNSSSNLNHTQ
ncbi:hypothetical protein DEO72_LG2g3883 [Vigna unguiculata]|uniref:Uncharacterized protein n=1 Tax=Vigna unguiculata TaxID=3917 RepID=A0A4D6L4U6_VIGUN|nr:hypothetical protein DEO72_LG2g3883 [Vigna unguiculata]